MDEEINVKEFLEERNDEINELIDSLNRKQKNLEFQRLPFYKRRKTKSIQPKKKKTSKTKNRKREERADWLPTHIYFAKRFFMTELNHKKVPLERFQKSDKFIYKSAYRGFLFDEGFLGFEKKLKKNYSDLNTKKDCFFHETIYKGEPISYFSSNENIYIQSPSNPLDSDFYSFSIYFGRHLSFGKFNLKDFDKIFLKEIIPRKISEYIKNSKIREPTSFNMEITEEFEGLYVLPTENIFQYKIVFKKSLCKDIFNKFICKGYIPISLKELLRISIEAKIILNFEYQKSKFSEKFNDAIFKLKREKFERTPKGKRKEYENTFELTKKFENCYFFSLEKGNFQRGSFVYLNNQIKGIVLRGSYSFSLGKEIGIISMDNFDENGEYFMKSLKNQKEYLIKRI